MQLKDKPYKTSLHTTSLRLDLREKVCRQQINIGVKKYAYRECSQKQRASGFIHIAINVIIII